MQPSPCAESHHSASDCKEAAAELKPADEVIAPKPQHTHTHTQIAMCTHTHAHGPGHTHSQPPLAPCPSLAVPSCWSLSRRPGTRGRHKPHQAPLLCQAPTSTFRQ